MVNTTAQTLKLSQGAVSSLILSTAGPQIQAECQQLAPDGIAFGRVIETSGYGLPCRKVYHGACQNWDNAAGPCEAVSDQTFYVTFCLRLTELLHFTHLSYFYPRIVMPGLRVFNPAYFELVPRLGNGRVVAELHPA